MTTLDDAPELHPESAAIITALLDSVLDDVTHFQVDEEALARFACGWITADESDAVIAALASSNYFRTRLVDMRKSLGDAAATPVARDAIFEKDAPLKRAMTAALAASVQALSRWNEACEKGRKKSGVSLEDRRSLRAIMMGVGMRLQDSGLQPAFASHRGAAQAGKVMVEPGNVFAELTVQAEEDQSLTARAKFSKPFEEAQEVSLYVVEPGGLGLGLDRIWLVDLIGPWKLLILRQCLASIQARFQAAASHSRKDDGLCPEAGRHSGLVRIWNTGESLRQLACGCESRPPFEMETWP